MDYVAAFRLATVAYIVGITLLGWFALAPWLDRLSESHFAIAIAGVFAAMLVAWGIAVFIRIVFPLYRPAINAANLAWLTCYLAFLWKLYRIRRRKEQLNDNPLHTDA